MDTKQLRLSITTVMTLAFAALGVSAAPQPTWHFKSNPGGRAGHSAVYDPTSNRLIVFGGNTAYTQQFELNDLWFLNEANSTSGTQSWTPVIIDPSVAPPPRQMHTAVYNPTSNIMIVFGGAGGYANPVYNDVWALANANGNGGVPTWTQLSPTGTPPAARFGHTAVYNATSDTMVVFGGVSGEGVFFNDTWKLINASGASGTPQWIQLNPSGSITARYAHSAVYNATNDEMVVYGGEDSSSNILQDIATLTNATTGNPVCFPHVVCPAWSDETLTGPNLALHTAVYDPVSDHMMVFGGISTGGVWNADVWILLETTGTNRSWTPVIPLPSPDYTANHTAAYDAAANKMIVYGGQVQIPNGGNIFWSENAYVLTDANGYPSVP